MEITSKNNVFIKNLKKEKAKNKFLLFLDTPNLVKEALNNNLKLKHLLIESGKNFDFVFEKHKEKIIFVSKEILNIFSDVKTQAGIIGIFYFEASTFENPQENYLVLDNLQEPGNVGTLLRSALGAGFNYIYLIDCPAITHAKVVRASAGAVLKLKLFQLSKQEFLKRFKDKNLYGAVLQGENIFLKEFLKPVGLALGNEGNGLSKEIKALLKENLTIPMQNNLESLNVAVSGSIIMFQIKNRGI